MTIALGTAIGGRRIIDTVGREMVSIGPREGLSADAAGGAALLLSTLLGLPVSTTHTRTAALLGAARGSGREVEWRVGARVALAWLLTFPACMGIGYLMARLFLRT